MYTFGQQETTLQLKGEVPEWAAGTAAIIKSIADPGVAAYSAHLRNDINKERLKAGLPPLLPRSVSQPPPPPEPPPEETFAIGGIALFFIFIMLISGNKKTKKKETIVSSE